MPRTINNLVILLLIGVSGLNDEKITFSERLFTFMLSIASSLCVVSHTRAVVVRSTPLRPSPFLSFYPEISEQTFDFFAS